MSAIKRRGFLVGILALPFIAPLARAATAVKRKLFTTIYVGKGQSHSTLSSAIQDIEPGGTIYLMPGHYEAINLNDKPGLSFVGVSRDDRARFEWKP